MAWQTPAPDPMSSRQASLGTCQLVSEASQVLKPMASPTKVRGGLSVLICLMQRMTRLLVIQLMRYRVACLGPTLSRGSVQFSSHAQPCSRQRIWAT